MDAGAELAAILRDGRAKSAASSEREKELNLGWRGRMTFRDSSLGGNFDSQRPHSGVEYSTFWGLATPSGDSFSRSQDEVRVLDFDRSMRLVSSTRSTSILT